MKIAAVVVTFNRIDCLRRNLNSLLEQTYPLDIIYVIDNASTDTTSIYMETIKKKNVRYIKKKENTGGAGGFYTGLKMAYDEGADWIWGMDDDAYPKRDALQKLVDCIMDDGICLWSNCDEDKDFLSRFKEVKSWMFVGFFLSRKVIYEVGLPREDFFIYLDDSEYAYRIRKRGFRILKVKDSIIIHRATIEIQYPVKKIGPILLKWHKLPNWKYYYWVRNYILLFPWNDYNRYITLFLKMPKILLYTLIFNKKQIVVFFQAYRDGLLGKTGKQNIID